MGLMLRDLEPYNKGDPGPEITQPKDHITWGHSAVLAWLALFKGCYNCKSKEQ